MKKKAWYKKWWIWVILGIISTIFFAIVGACSDETVEDINNTSIVATESTAETESTIKETEAKTETTATEADTEKAAEETTEIETYYEQPVTEAQTYENEYAEAETEEEYTPAVEAETEQVYVPIVEEEPKDEGRDYVINTNSGKFHYPSCTSVNRIKAHNREDYYGTRDELTNMGYEACGNCYP